MGLFLRHEAAHLLRVAGDNRRVARLGEGVPDVPQRLGVVVHHQNPLPLPFRPPASGGGLSWSSRRAGAGLLDHRNGEGEPAAQARTVALGPDAAPVGFHYPLADGQPQPRPLQVAPPILALHAGELPEQVGQTLGRYARAVVGHGDRDVEVLRHGGHPDA